MPGRVGQHSRPLSALRSSTQQYAAVPYRVGLAPLWVVPQGNEEILSSRYEAHVAPPHLNVALKRRVLPGGEQREASTHTESVVWQPASKQQTQRWRRQPGRDSLQQLHARRPQPHEPVRACTCGRSYIRPCSSAYGGPSPESGRASLLQQQSAAQHVTEQQAETANGQTRSTSSAANKRLLSKQGAAGIPVKGARMRGGAVAVRRQLPHHGSDARSKLFQQLHPYLPKLRVHRHRSPRVRQAGLPQLRMQVSCRKPSAAIVAADVSRSSSHTPEFASGLGQAYTCMPGR